MSSVLISLLSIYHYAQFTRMLRRDDVPLQIIKYQVQCSTTDP